MTQPAQQPVPAPDGCPECGPDTPLAIQWVHVPGMVNVPEQRRDDSDPPLRPCSTCNVDRYQAWQADTMANPSRLPSPCTRCGEETQGQIVPNGGHLMLVCGRCGAYKKNVSKRLAGVPQRSVRSRPTLKPSQRTRILLRAGHRCEQCGAPAATTTLHIGHILSREDGLAQGVPEDLLDSDDNLIAQCEECNLGLGKASLPLRLAVALLTARAGGAGADA